MSDSQTIGEIGKKVFTGNSPDSWRPESEPVQGADFGFDYSMWLATLEGPRGRFSVQLKTGAKTEFSGGADPFISVALTREVCNLYLQDRGPVFLVYVDLPEGLTSKNAVMYCLRLDQELQARLKGKEFFDESSFPAEMSFRVKKSQILDKETDITEYVSTYWDFSRVVAKFGTQEGRAAVRAVAELPQTGWETLAAMGKSTLAKMLDEYTPGSVSAPENPEPRNAADLEVPEPGSDAATIKHLASLITSGALADAEPVASVLLAKQDELPAEVAATLFYQVGRLRSLAGRPNEAFVEFSRAAALKPDSANYFAVKLESAITAHWNVQQSPHDSDLLSQLASDSVVFKDSPEVKFQLARIYALQDEYEAAEKVISELPASERVKAATLYSVARGRWKEAIAEADAGMASATEQKDRLFLLALKLRALLHVVLGTDASINIGGPANFDVQDALGLKEATLDALERFRAAGWPSNSALLMDCASAVAVIFGVTDELSELVSDFAKKRPDLEVAQEAAARIGALSDNPKAALAAVERMDSQEPEDLAKKAILYNEANMLPEGVQLAVEKLIKLQHSHLTDLAVGLSAISAHRLGMTTEERLLNAFLDEPSVERTAKLLVEHLRRNLKNPEDSAESLNVLWAEYKSGEHSEALADNLFMWLRPDRAEDIDRLIELGDAAAVRRGLTDMEAGKYTAALLHRARYADVVSTTDTLHRIYPEDENIGLSRSVALDRLGRSAEAEEVLQSFPDSTRLDLLHARTQLLIRTGEFETAIKVAQRGLLNAKTHHDKFQLHRMLATLYSSKGPQRYYDAVWRLGELSQRDDEKEEGAFLANYAMASARIEDVPDAHVKEFHERIENYRTAFPDSTYFRVGTMSENAGPNEMVANLRALAGITPEREATNERLRKVGETQGSGIPFAYRPRTYAPFVSNLVDLLSFTTSGPVRHEWSRVIVGGIDRSAPPAFDLPPVLDLLTVFILVELGLFPSLFQRWGTIAIPKATLRQLAEFQVEPIGPSDAGLVDSVTNAIKTHKAHIFQPETPTGAGAYPQNESAAIAATVAHGNYQYLTFDCATAYLHDTDNAPTNQSLTLWDVVGELENAAVITDEAARDIRLKVASWNTVGTPLTPEDVAKACWQLDAEALKDGAANPLRRVIESYIESEADPTVATTNVANALVKFAGNPSAENGPRVQWFLTTVFRKFLLARAMNYNDDADNLAATIATKLVAKAESFGSSVEGMRFIWYALNQVRTEFGGTNDTESYLKSLGQIAARLLGPVIKKHGIGAFAVEAGYLSLLFSFAGEGTKERGIAHDAYIEETLLLKKQSQV